MLKHFFVLSFFTVYVFAFNGGISSEYSINAAEKSGCHIRYPNVTNFTPQTTSSTVYTTETFDFEYCESSNTPDAHYDAEIDRVVAITSCSSTTNVVDGVEFVESTIELSHLNFTCGDGCRVPLTPSGTNYQLYPNFSQSECTLSNASYLYEQANPSSPYEIADVKWVDCFDSGSTLNGCYFYLQLKNPPDTNSTSTENNTTDTNSTNTNNPNTGTNTGTNTSNSDLSNLEYLLSGIRTNTGNSAHDISSIKTLVDIIADIDFDRAGADASIDSEVQYDHNRSKLEFDMMIRNAGLDFNESNGSKFDVYSNAIGAFHGELYNELLDDNGSYSIKGLFEGVLLDIANIGANANPFLLFIEKGSTSQFEPFVINYQSSSYDWLAFSIPITGDVMFSGPMANFWFMIRIFLMFFAVWYGFMILIKGL